LPSTVTTLNLSDNRIGIKGVKLLAGKLPFALT